MDGIFDLNFIKIGLPLVFVKQGVPIHIMVRTKTQDISDTANSYNYGYDGLEYEDIGGQDLDFVIEESPKNEAWCGSCVDFG